MIFGTRITHIRALEHKGWGLEYSNTEKHEVGRFWEIRVRDGDWENTEKHMRLGEMG